MDSRGLSQVELAEMLSLSQAQVSRFLNGSRSLSLPVVLQLADITGIPAERLSNSPRVSRILKLWGTRTTSRTETLNGQHRIV